MGKKQIHLFLKVPRNTSEVIKQVDIQDELAINGKYGIADQTTTIIRDPDNSNNMIVLSTVTFNTKHQDYEDWCNELLDNHRTNAFYDDILPGSKCTIEDLSTGDESTVWIISNGTE